MSFEGFCETLCTKGHYGSFDVYDAGKDKKCEVCDGPLVWIRTVDITNGEDPSDPFTSPAPLEESGWEDAWREDHYGNKYALKRKLWRIPAGLEHLWTKVDDGV